MPTEKPASKRMVLAIALIVYTAERVRGSPIDQDKVERLARSLKTHSLLNAIHVYHVGDGTYQVWTGLHRLLAAKSLGWTEITAEVWAAEPDPVTKLLVEYSENHDRFSLSPAEEVAQLRALKQAMGCDDRGLAAATNNDPARLCRLFRVFDTLAPDLLPLLDKGLPITSAYHVAGVPDHALQREIAEQAIKHGWNSKAVAAACKAQGATRKPRKAVKMSLKVRSESLSALIEDLTAALQKAKELAKSPAASTLQGNVLGKVFATEGKKS